MKEFSHRYEDRIHGVLSCFDRMLFRGYLPIMSGWQMAEFFNSRNIVFRFLCIVHVSLTRYVDLFPPSLRWVPWPPQRPWPCGSPLSSVLWVRKTPPGPSSSFPVSLNDEYLLCSAGRPGALPSSWGIPLKACPGLWTPAAHDNLA